MKFGFIAHARRASELRKAFLLRHDVSLIPFLPEGKIVSKALEVGLIKDIFTYRQVWSAQHEKCSGKIFCVFLTAEQLLTNQERAVELVVEACRQAKEWGAEIVGLGAMTAVVGSRGKEINQHSPVPVTTGNSLAVYSSLRAFRDMVKKLGIDIHRQKIVIVGFPGSIGLAIARLLIEEGVRLLLVGRGKTPFIDRFIAGLDEEAKRRVEISTDLKDALTKGRIAFSATSTGSIIDPDTLKPGSIIFDIAQPRDVIQKKEKRRYQKYSLQCRLPFFEYTLDEGEDMRRIITLCAALMTPTVVGAEALAGAHGERAGITAVARHVFDDAIMPGKEFRVLHTTYAPGGQNPMHYHPSHVVFYVLEGSGVWQEEGKEAVTLKPGDSLHVRPGTIHAHRNASATEKLLFLEFVIVDKGQRSTVPMR